MNNRNNRNLILFGFITFVIFAVVYLIYVAFFQKSSGEPEIPAPDSVPISELPTFLPSPTIYRTGLPDTITASGVLI